ncbi:Hsp20/alpha crystallin family protein [Garicola koreensis]|uniref:HSP20 family protein n=1 Tax=Garicola koreensis TaxID=1262554 RepID=A0A7W5U1G3_9MICC|nr:Hsp20/alpha crystallin family protein [Garicola koreensis]MBB3667486.1 HSP20 family protein [Garicola koreensis]
MIHTSLTRLDPFSLIDDVFRQARAPLADQSQRASGFVPAIDAHRDGDDLVAAVDLPGIDPENDVAVELSNSGRTLTISGERRTEREAEGLREVRYGSFSRTVNLPEDVSQDAISATYDAGVLTVRVAGIYAEEQPRRIHITAGAGAKQVPAADEGKKLDA